MLSDRQIRRLMGNMVSLPLTIQDRIRQATPTDGDSSAVAYWVQSLYTVRVFQTRLNYAMMMFFEGYTGTEVAAALFRVMDSELASEVWEIFAQVMPLCAYETAGDGLVAERDGVSPWQMLLPF